MARAYSIGLRERVLAASESGEGSQTELAKRFRIGERTLSRWLRTARTEGRREPKPRAGGPGPLGGQSAVLAELAAGQSDGALAEYADRLAARTGIKRSSSVVCRTLEGLGLVRRKRPSRQPSRSVPMSPGRGRYGVLSWPGSIQAA